MLQLDARDERARTMRCVAMKRFDEERARWLREIFRFVNDFSKIALQKSKEFVQLLDKVHHSDK